MDKRPSQLVIQQFYRPTKAGRFLVIHARLLGRPCLIYRAEVIHARDTCFMAPSLCIKPIIVGAHTNDSCCMEMRGSVALLSGKV